MHVYSCIHILYDSFLSYNQSKLTFMHSFVHSFVRSFMHSLHPLYSLCSPNNGESVVKLLVGNKIDMERQVDRERAEAWARSHGMLFLESSAKTRLGIKQVFMEVVQKILENPEALATAVPGKPKLQIKRPIEASEDEDELGGCC